MNSVTDILSPPAIASFPGRRFTVDENRQMGRIGLLSEADRIELLEGWIAPKKIHDPCHDACVDLCTEAIRTLLPPGWRLRVQSAITTSDSEPEPDIAVVRGTARDYVERHAQSPDIGLLVEVAGTSLRRDRLKRRVYARAGIPIYWLVNLVDAQVEVYADPSGPLSRPAYGRHVVRTRGEQIPLALDATRLGVVEVSDVLP